MKRARRNYKTAFGIPRRFAGPALEHFDSGVWACGGLGLEVVLLGFGQGSAGTQDSPGEDS